MTLFNTGYFALLIGLGFGGYRLGRTLPRVSNVIGVSVLFATAFFWFLATTGKDQGHGPGAALGLAIAVIASTFPVVAGFALICGSIVRKVAGPAEGKFDRQAANFLAAFSIITVVAGMIYWGLIAEPANFCATRGKALSDKEFIELAVRDVSHNMRIDGSEEAIRGFHAKHPNCCRIRRNVGTLLDAMTGYATAEVEMYYELKAPRGPEDYYHQYIVLNRCGDIGHTYGMGLQKKNLPSWAR